MERLRYKGYFYEAGRPRVNYSSIISVVTLLCFGIAFVGIASVYDTQTAIIALFFGAAAILAFVRGETLPYILILAFMFPKPMHFQDRNVFPIDFVFMLMFASVGVRAALKRKILFPPTFYTLIGLGYIIFSAISSMNGEKILRSMPQIVQYIYYILVIPILVINLVGDTKRIMKLMKFITLIVVAQSILIIVQSLLIQGGDTTIGQMFSYANRGAAAGSTERAFGSMGPGVALFFGVGAVVLFYGIADKGVPVIRKTMIVPGILLVVYANFCTGMRFSMVVIGLMAIGVSFFTRRFFMSFVLTCFAMLTILFIVTTGKDVFPFNLFYGHTEHRSMDMQVAMDTFENNMLVGVGPGQYTRVRPWGDAPGVENEMVRNLVEGGIIGGAAFVIWIVTPFMLAGFTAMNTRNPELAVTAGVLAFCMLVFILNGLFVADLFEGGFGHLMVFIVGMILIVYRAFAAEKAEIQAKLEKLRPSAKQ